MTRGGPKGPPFLWAFSHWRGAVGFCGIAGRGLLRGRACCGRMFVSAYGRGTALTGGGWPGSVGSCPTRLARTSMSAGHPLPPGRRKARGCHVFDRGASGEWEEKSPASHCHWPPAGSRLRERPHCRSGFSRDRGMLRSRLKPLLHERAYRSLFPADGGNGRAVPTPEADQTNRPQHARPSTNPISCKPQKLGTQAVREEFSWLRPGKKKARLRGPRRTVVASDGLSFRPPIRSASRPGRARPAGARAHRPWPGIPRPPARPPPARWRHGPHR